MIYLYRIEIDKNRFEAVSLLSPEEVFGKGLPSQVIIGTVPENASSINQNNFKSNSIFVDFLHTIIKRHAPVNPGLQSSVQQQPNGWVYVIDCRADDPQGEVEPEDIIGAFKIESGRVTPESYKKNNKHLLVSKRGVFCLDQWLERALLEETRLLLATSKSMS